MPSNFRISRNFINKLNCPRIKKNFHRNTLLPIGNLFSENNQINYFSNFNILLCHKERNQLTTWEYINIFVTISEINCVEKVDQQN